MKSSASAPIEYILLITLAAIIIVAFMSFSFNAYTQTTGGSQAGLNCFININDPGCKTCPNGTCDSAIGEDCNSCPDDCGPCSPITCPSSTCDAGEDCTCEDCVGQTIGGDECCDSVTDCAGNDLCVTPTCPSNVCIYTPIDDAEDSSGASTCISPSRCCLGSCFNMQNDPNNCGSCGTECDPGQTCLNGACIDVIHGVCDESVTNGCSSGTLNDILDSPTDYLWECVGQPPGTTDSCSERIPVTCDCNSCLDCTTKLASPACDIVRLTADITTAGACVIMTDAKTFDCQSHEIRGTCLPVSTSCGTVGVRGECISDSTVQNCVLKDLEAGVYSTATSCNPAVTPEADNNIFKDNDISNSVFGIYLSDSDGNQVTGNTVTGCVGNGPGIYMYRTSSNNRILSNTVCGCVADRSIAEFAVGGAVPAGNTGDENTCDVVTGWHDDGMAAGCTYKCSPYYANGINDCEELQMIGNHPSYPLSQAYRINPIPERNFGHNYIDCSATKPSNWANPTYVNFLWENGYSIRFPNGYDGIAGNADDSIPSLEVGLLGSKGFKPIGTQAAPFTGGLAEFSTLQVQNLFINRPTEDYVGLFSKIALTAVLAPFKVSISDADVTGRDYVGALAGYIGGVIAPSDNAVNNPKVTGQNYVGGIAGYLFPGCSGCTVSGVQIVGTGDHVGGVFGLIRDQVYGSICLSGSISGHNYVGGLAGTSYAGSVISSMPVRLTYSTCSVSGTISVGGLIGQNGIWGGSGGITDAFSTGSVTGQTDVGGLVGTNGRSGYITRSFATGSVTGNTDVGGLVGSLYASMPADGTSEVRESYSIGTVSGTFNVGGLVGFAEGSQGQQARIIDSYSISQVTGPANKGGLLGVKGLYDVVITDSYWNTDRCPICNNGYGIGVDNNAMATTQVSTFSSIWDTVNWHIENWGEASFPVSQDAYAYPCMKWWYDLTSSIKKQFYPVNPPSCRLPNT